MKYSIVHVKFCPEEGEQPPSEFESAALPYAENHLQAKMLYGGSQGY